MSSLQLFKCLNPACALTSTLQGASDMDSFSSSCIHCGAEHEVRRQTADNKVAYTVIGLAGKPDDGDGKK